MTDGSRAKRISAAHALEVDFLGGLIRSPAAIDEARDQLRPEDLHHDAHAEMFRLLLDMHDRKIRIDLLSVCDEARRWPRSLAEQTDIWVASIFGGAGYNPLARIPQLVELALERGVDFVLAEATSEADRPTGPVEQRIEVIQDGLTKLTQRLPGVDSVPVRDGVNEALEAIDARRRGEQTAGVPTGFPSLDDALCGGLPAGQLTILAARPSVGKTSFALNVIRAACKAGRRVFFASLEQRRQEIVERLLAAEGRVNGQSIRTGLLDPDEQDRVLAAAAEVRGWNLHIADAGGVRVGRIATGSRFARRKMAGIDLVVVDYLQLIRGDNDRDNRNEQVGQAAERLRTLGKDLDVPVLLLSQLSRQAANESTPALHHLRDSGVIEQVADAVMFLHRVGQPGETPDRIDLNIAKQRNGPLATLNFHHEARYFRFQDATGIPG